MKTLDVEKREHPFGERGVRSSLEEVVKKATEGGMRADVRRWAIDMLDQARKRGVSVNSPESRARVLLQAVQEKLWVPDPVGTEFIQGAHLTACTDPDSPCFQGGDCFPAGTLVFSPGHGLLPLKEVEVGTKIWGLNSWSVVEAVQDKGILPVDAIELSTGPKLKLTTNHQVYVLRGQEEQRIRISELEPGDLLVTPSRLPASKENRPSEGEPRRVKSIERSVLSVPCYDIQTSDHRVYLPEHDVTVSNCDDLATLLGAAFLSVGIDTMIVGHGYDEKKNISHVLTAAHINGRWNYADPSPAGDTHMPFGKCVPFTRERVYSLPDEKMLCDKNACLVPGRSFDPKHFVNKGNFVGVNGPPQFSWRLQWLEEPATPAPPVRWLGQLGPVNTPPPQQQTQQEYYNQKRSWTPAEKILFAGLVLGFVNTSVQLWDIKRRNAIKSL